MTTAVDTNVIAALWDADAELSGMANHALDEAMARGRLVISAPVFAELMAMPRRNEAFLDGFLRDVIAGGGQLHGKRASGLSPRKK